MQADQSASAEKRLNVAERRRAEWTRVHNAGEPKRLYGGWTRYYHPQEGRYFYAPPATVAVPAPPGQWNPPLDIPMGPHGGVDLTQQDRVHKLRIAINQIRDLSAAEKLILHEFVAPVFDPPDVAWIQLETLARNAGTDRQTVYRAVKHFESLGLVECLPRSHVKSPRLKRLHPRNLFFRFLPGTWLKLEPSNDAS